MDPEDFVDVTPDYIKDYRKYIERAELPYIEFDQIFLEADEYQNYYGEQIDTDSSDESSGQKVSADSLDSADISEEIKSQLDELVSEFNSEPKYISVLLVGSKVVGKQILAEFTAERLDENYKEFDSAMPDLSGNLYDALLDDDTDFVILRRIEMLDDSQISDLIRCAKGKKLPIKIGEGPSARDVSIKPDGTFFMATFSNEGDESGSLQEIFDYVFRFD